MKSRALTFLLALSTAAYAGHSQGQYVTITTSSSGTSASGSLRTARNSPDWMQYIGCTVYTTYATASTPIVMCAAVDATGQQHHCINTNAAMATSASSIGPFSWIHFRTSNSAPTQCASLSVSNNSMFAPGE